MSSKEKNKNWPLVDRDQDSICIHSMVSLLERVLDAVPGETRISYYAPGIIDEEGGSIEINFLVDYLHYSEIRELGDFECQEMKDGQPSVRVSIHYLWDEDVRKHLVEKWEKKNEEYPDSLWREYFVVDIEMAYTKNDWNTVIERGRPNDKETKSKKG